jgi:hypothetical protein
MVFTYSSLKKVKDGVRLLKKVKDGVRLLKFEEGKEVREETRNFFGR